VDISGDFLNLSLSLGGQFVANFRRLLALFFCPWTHHRTKKCLPLTWGFAILGQDVVIFIFSNMEAVVRAGQAPLGFWLLSCTARAAPICFSISSGSRLDVFQIPQHRKALFVSGDFGNATKTKSETNCFKNKRTSRTPL